MDAAKCGRCAEATGSLMVAAIQASILLGAVVGGVLTISATFVGSVILAGIGIALIGNGRLLLKPEEDWPRQREWLNSNPNLQEIGNAYE
ncbi:hypothetical protein [Mesorhizobium sp.]|uniref:hypothetical protein n=1 Tax=Mesorhizobium TaxID=68287 RepID=UPI00257B3719|nr:hypothetical protein [Mesorhizobium sp.]